MLDGFDILRVTGQFAAPVAIAETLLAGHFLDAAGIKCPSGPLTVAPLRLGDQFTCAPDGSISGAARAVPHMGDASAVVVIADHTSETRTWSIRCSRRMAIFSRPLKRRRDFAMQNASVRAPLKV